MIALAAVRATREARVDGHGGPALEAVIGTPIEGERIGGEIFDGKTEAAIFPGELPADPKAVFRDAAIAATAPPRKSIIASCAFARRPRPRRRMGAPLPPPHIRLDRALQFLIGDKLA